MTPSLPHDRPAPNASTEVTRSTQWSVGWALTAITCTILVVGIAIIQQLSAVPEPLRTDSETNAEISSAETAKEESPPRLVLRPEESDSVSIPLYQQDSLFQQGPLFQLGPLSRQGVPASWEQDDTPEESFILPAYR